MFFFHPFWIDCTVTLRCISAILTRQTGLYAVILHAKLICLCRLLLWIYFIEMEKALVRIRSGRGTCPQCLEPEIHLFLGNLQYNDHLMWHSVHFNTNLLVSLQLLLWNLIHHHECFDRLMLVYVHHPPPSPPNGWLVSFGISEYFYVSVLV